MGAFTVGLTGGLASGKSTVARRLARAGFKVVDADRLVADLYAPDQPGARVVRRLFGPALLNPDGSVDKPALAARIFSDAAERTRLEAEIHPLVGARFREIAERGEGIFVLEAAKLVESGLADDFDAVVTVEAPEVARLERAARRRLPPGEAARRIAAQASAAARRSRADRVIDNSGSRAVLAQQVDELIAELRQRARLA